MAISIFAHSKTWNYLLLMLPLLCFCSPQIRAQEKFEKEYRIKEKHVPQKALAFIQAAEFDAKIKWFREQGLDQSTVEAKTKHKGSKYSVEFNLEGELEDIEYTVRWEDIPPFTQSKIKAYWEETHEKTRIVKIQRQWTGDTNELLKALSNPKESGEMVVKYEIVIKARTKKEHEMIEYLFSEEGEMERKSIILFKNADHLEY